MNPAHEPKRRWLRWGRPRSSQRSLEGSAVPVPVERQSVEALHYGTRRTLGTVTLIAGVVALTHQPVTDALTASHGAVLSAAHAVLVWPAPLTQPVLAGVGAFVLSIMGVESRGWQQMTRRQRRYL